jgi:hypothetical protein
MQVSETTQINDSSEKVWNTIRSFDGVERYLQIVTKSVMELRGICQL